MELAVLKRGGLFAYLGTNDLRKVVARMEDGDELARRVFHGLAYGIAKHTASMAPALADEHGQVNVAAVILTGGLARNALLMTELTRMIGYLGPIEIVPGEVEMASLAAGAERALRGLEPVREYL